MFAIVYQLDAMPILLISGRYQFLKAKRIEVNLKIPDEIRLSWIIAAAVYYFVIKVVAVVPELVLYI